MVSGVICHSYDLEKALSKNHRCQSQIQRMNFSPCTLLLFVVLGKLLRTLALDFLIYKMKTIPCCCLETQSHCIAQIHLALIVILLPQSSAQVAGVPGSFLLNFQVGKIYKIVGFIMTFSRSCIMMLCSKSYSCPHRKYNPYL